MSIYTPNIVRDRYRTDKHFFAPESMRFFGDTMNSYGCTVVDGVDYMYRHRDATVSVFGRRTRAGRDFFNCWRITTTDTGEVDLEHCDQEVTDKVYSSLYE